MTVLTLVGLGVVVCIPVDVLGSVAWRNLTRFILGHEVYSLFMNNTIHEVIIHDCMCNSSYISIKHWLDPNWHLGQQRELIESFYGAEISSVIHSSYSGSKYLVCVDI